MQLSLFKTCSKCGQTKFVLEFTTDKEATTGRSSACHTCEAQRMKEYEKNKRAQRDETFLEKDREKSRRKHERKKESINERHRVWHKNNQDKRHIYANNRRARTKNAAGQITAQEFIELCAAYGNICLCCKEQKPLTADHVIPLSCGGSNSIDNIQPLCSTCNSKKFTKTIDYREVT
jgi:5-methylcytosine-specific restriction endonuclease McrA